MQGLRILRARLAMEWISSSKEKVGFLFHTHLGTMLEIGIPTPPLGQGNPSNEGNAMWAKKNRNFLLEEFFL